MELLILLPILILALSFHEASHAFVAYKLGDPTPKMQGRVTLNPLSHLDFFGTALLVLTAIAGGPVFGWGKPVQVSSYNFKNPKRDYGIVAFAGPLSNLLLAVFSLVLVYFATTPLVLALLQSFILINVSLALFNLLPIYPLDGFNVLYALLPVNLAYQLQETSKYGVLVLLLVVFTGGLGRIFSPVFMFVNTLINQIIFLR